MANELHVVFDIDMTLILSTECIFDESGRAVRCDPALSPRASSPRRRRALADEFPSLDFFDLPEFNLRVNLRPDSISTLDALFNRDEISVSLWSAGDVNYVRAVANRLEQEVNNYARRNKRAGRARFEIVWARDMCELNDDGELVKPLIKMIESDEGRALGMHEDNIMLVDDLDLNAGLNAGKVYYIKAYDRVNRFDFALKQLLYNIMMYIREPSVLPNGVSE